MTCGEASPSSARLERRATGFFSERNDLGVGRDPDHPGMGADTKTPAALAAGLLVSCIESLPEIFAVSVDGDRAVAAPALFNNADGIDFPAAGHVGAGVGAGRQQAVFALA